MMNYCFLLPKMPPSCQRLRAPTSTLTLLFVLISISFLQNDLLVVNALGLRSVLRDEGTALRDPSESTISASTTTEEANVRSTLVKREDSSALVPISFAQTFPSRRERGFKFCVKSGLVDSNGKNLLTAFYCTSPMKCQDECQQRGGCQLFAYSEEQRICQLYYAAAISYFSKDSQWVWGPRNCDQGLAYINTQTEYPGSNISYFHSQDALTCSDSCLADPQCDAFTYFRNNSRCFTKRYTSAWGRKTNSQAVSSARPNALCIEMGIRYTAPQTGICKSVDSAAECQLLCRKDSSCTHFAYNLWEKSCLFMSTGRGFVYAENFASGPARCSRDNSDAQPLTDEAVRQTTFLQVGRVYEGPLVERATTQRTVVDCMNRCRRDENCYVFSFDIYSGECKLMTRDSLIWGRGNDSKMISGFSSFSTTCFQENTQGGQTQIGPEFSSWSALECHLICKLTPGCQFFSFNTSTLGCKMWEGEGSKYYSSGITSGPSECPPDSPILNYKPGTDYSRCFKVGIQYRGANAASHAFFVDSTEDCLFQCRNMSECKWFSHDALTNECLVFLDSAVMTKKTLPSAVSGPVHCASCVDQDTRYTGTIVGDSVRTYTVEECMGHCRNTQNCTHVRWSKKYLTCDLLKDITATEDEEGRLSAPAVCP